MDSASTLQQVVESGAFQELSPQLKVALFLGGMAFLSSALVTMTAFHSYRDRPVICAASSGDAGDSSHAGDSWAVAVLDLLCHGPDVLDYRNRRDQALSCRTDQRRNCVP